jgi:hypothetical protein
MGAKVKKTKATRSLETAESEEEAKAGSIFQRLFAPASVGTSYSQDDDGSAGSETHLSTLSASTASHDSSDGETENQDSKVDLQKFDRELRARHRGACKNMTVSLVPGRDRWSRPVPYASAHSFVSVDRAGSMARQLRDLKVFLQSYLISLEKNTIVLVLHSTMWPWQI